MLNIKLRTKVHYKFWEKIEYNVSCYIYYKIVSQIVDELQAYGLNENDNRISLVLKNETNGSEKSKLNFYNNFNELTFYYSTIIKSKLNKLIKFLNKNLNCIFLYF